MSHIQAGMAGLPLRPSLSEARKHTCKGLSLPRSIEYLDPSHPVFSKMHAVQGTFVSHFLADDHVIPLDEIRQKILQDNAAIRVDMWDSKVAKQKKLLYTSGAACCLAICVVDTVNGNVGLSHVSEPYHRDSIMNLVSQLIEEDSQLDITLLGGDAGSLTKIKKIIRNAPLSTPINLNDQKMPFGFVEDADKTGGVDVVIYHGNLYWSYTKLNAFGII